MLAQPDLAVAARSLVVAKGFNSSRLPLHSRARDRVEVAVLFADVVGSTELLLKIGDDSWASLLEQYYYVATQNIARFEGTLQSTYGDGFHACFDCPVRALQCAFTLRRKVNNLGLKIRIGLHFGLCVKVGGSLAGLTVHIGARIASAARADEVLISEQLNKRLEDFQLTPAEQRTYCLKGLPGKWRLFNYSWNDQAKAVETLPLPARA